MEDKKCMISVQNVTMTFRKEEDFSGSLKETVTKLFSGRMKFTKFTALRDLSFNVYQGETVGLIGRNGAGKSTTLKIISGIMKPTSGTVVRNGNIVPMLELGSGFDYDLSGKENIFLNGAVLGYAKDATALRMIETYGAYMPDGTFLSQSEAPNTSHIFGNTLATSTLLVLIPLADYNEAAGENVVLSNDEALIQVWKEGKPEPAADAPERFACSGGKELRNAGAPDMQALHLFVETTGGTVIAVMNDPAAYMHDLAENYDYVYYRFYFAVDLTDEGKAFYDAADGEETRFGFVGRLRDNIPQDVDLGYTSVSRSEMRASLYALYGGLFFLGIMLSFIFLIAAVLIIYYKQVCEGFEDAARFDVMRKVGMTRREIRRAIDSQVLTVFFAPLVMAGLHIAFAFPMIRHILMLFDVTDLALLVPVYIASFVLFALFYALIYRRTAKTYLSIVSPAQE